MIIKEIIEQHRRDFTAIYLCEHCGYEQEGKGYDDANFHKNGVPTMKCPNCGEVAKPNYRPLTTKYPQGFQV
jgi:predicted RNA-binding Zn-ribbon protein involved in translation (DUF1610 family)